ncbi:2Fe-2S iron-sulfur cluster-binding protein [Luteibacter sp. PPL201]|uniref:2Fe-2S iron-sulfur cluster-binding protein n=1 Tax=Luteibacter sahnii TaxID=3021977 RepID=A0ABT6BCT0_9GAMM|nr:2Fe-2S iron-sulfur cluster-binding protein [Luteibacter sp. PPL193]MDY1547643.1 2Fe-2S iron-sulfur cluster-binding protein [Luteibacter sp. PPL193]
MTVSLYIDGHVTVVPAGSSVAAAIAAVTPIFRRSVHGTPRAPVCGMGVCFECRVTINGLAQQRACQVQAREGMRVSTDG